MSKARLAVLGLHHGFKHASDLRSGEFAELVAVAGNDELSKKRAEQLGVPWRADYGDLLSDFGSQLDGVVVALPNDLHAPAVEMCAELGIHVLLEKPIAGSLEEGHRIIGARDRSGIKVLLGHHRRFSARMRKARQEIANGRLGELIGATVIWAARKHDSYYEAEWRVTPGQGGGPLLINTIHDVDDIHFLTGDRIEWVFARCSNKVRGFAVEDSSTIAFGTVRGILGTILVTDAGVSPWFYESNAGENPMFPYNGQNSYFLVGTRGSMALPNLRLYRYPSDKGSWLEPVWEEVLVVQPNDPMTAELLHFIRVIEGQEEPLVTAEDGLLALQVIEAIRKSDEARAAVRVGDPGRPLSS